ncbi:tetratricopeptide repeat protein [Lachnoclostridium sp. Marseille-P6806]|uniref:tetratricopeptide repeat protein n=1 Tax=Lachnoclostridium sp. Marseille-P6806 TaxID=2364793 RepID=UPI0010323D76|nr:tetratricopeptide repeat protein [Lachnoclostridium sp. Marseille-P6806]
MTEEFYQALDLLSQNGSAEEIEEFLVRSLLRADKEKNYEAYAAAAEEMVRFYQMTGQFDKAEAASNDLLLLLEEMEQDDTEYFASVLVRHANGYRDAGRYEEADRCYRRAGQILDRIQGGAESVGTLFSNMGMNHLAEGGFYEAEACFREANRAFESGELFRNPYYASNMAGIAEALYRQGSPAKALAQYEQLRDFIEKQDGRGKSYALICRNCAAVCDGMGDAATAAEYRAEAASVTDGMEGQSGL